MFGWVHIWIALTLALSLAAPARVPAQAASNDGLAADFGGFGGGGTIAEAPLSINDVALQQDGSIVAVGSRDDTVALARFTAGGTPDTGFGTQGLVTTVVAAQATAAAHAVALQPDGKIVVAGRLDGTRGGDFMVLRYTPAGALDTAFDGDGRVIVDFDGGDDSAEAVAIDSYGRIVVAGSARRGERHDFAVLRLDTGGTLDGAFDGDGKARVDFGGDAYALDMLLQPRGQIVLAGHVSVANGSAGVRHLAVARLVPDGTPDATWDGDGKLTTGISGDDRGSSVALVYDGRLVVAGTGAGATFVLARYNEDGSLDPTLDGDGKQSTPLGAPDTTASDLLVLGAGTALVAGRSDSHMAFVRYNEDGSPDTTWDGDGRLLLDISPLAAETVSSLLRAPDGRLLAAGGQVMARLFVDGTLDAGGRQLAVPVPDQVLEPVPEPKVAKYDPDAVDGAARSTLLQPGGGIISAGDVQYGDFDTDIALTRHTPDGQPDLSFGGHGRQVLVREDTYESAADALLQPQDGKIVVVGTAQNTQQEDSNLLLARFNADGSPDTSCARTGVATLDLFDNDRDTAHAVALQADGSILVAATVRFNLKPERRSVVVRFDAGCELDPKFGEDGILLLDYNSIVDVLALRDGKFLVVDHTDDVYALLARFDADGTPDAGFGKQGQLAVNLGGVGSVSATEELPGGKLLLAGSLPTKEGVEAFVLRLNPDGSPDVLFGTAGRAATNLGAADAFALAASDSGAIALAGCRSKEDLAAPIALFNASGELDRSFGDDGLARLVLGGPTCVQGAVFSGERLIAGGWAANGSNGSFALAAYAVGEQRDVGFSSAPATVAEAAGGTTLTISLSQTAAQAVTVHYAATGGSATNGTDYTLPAGTLQFEAGQTSRRIAMSIGDDRIDEADETLNLSLSSPTNAALGNSSLSLVIADDDPPLTGDQPARYRTYLPIGQK